MWSTDKSVPKSVVENDCKIMCFMRRIMQIHEGMDSRCRQYYETELKKNIHTNIHSRIAAVVAESIQPNLSVL